jgi:hypothetical protein
MSSSIPTPSETPLEAVSREIRRMANEPSFPFHRWMVPHHLEIVERLSQELCELHPEADKNFVGLLVWMHDFGNIVNFEKRHSTTQELGKDFLVGLGVDAALATRVIAAIEILDRKIPEELLSASIEIQIVSSADGASHMVGPFYLCYAQENPSMPVEELQKRQLAKLDKDWNLKIVLESVKTAFQPRYEALALSFGRVPNRLLEYKK